MRDRSIHRISQVTDIASNSELDAEIRACNSRRSPRRSGQVTTNTGDRSGVDTPPAWLPDLQASIQRLTMQQETFLQEMSGCTATIHDHKSCITTLQKRSEAHERLHTDHEGRLSRLERDSLTRYAQGGGLYSS